MRLAALGSTVQRAASPAYSSSRSASALRRRVLAAVLVAVSLLLITGYFRESEDGPLHGVQGVAASVLRPFQVAAERVARPFQDAYGWAAGFAHAKSENEQLRAQLQLLEAQASQNATAARENVDLRQALRYQGSQAFPRGYDSQGAAVISSGLSEFQQELVISAGRNDGIRVNDPVTDAAGHLVGAVSKTTKVSSRVTLLTDSSFAVSGYDVGSGTYGLVRHGEGSGESLIYDLVPKDKVVRRGDLIITAGRRSGELRSLYPRGIAVGTVTSVNQSDIDIHQTIQIAPLADFSSLSSAWVLIPKDRPR
jgi:rod shape-determining protein MreC